MATGIKIAFLSGTDDLNRLLIGEMRCLLPEAPLCIVSDFPPEETDAEWIPFAANRSFYDNLAGCRVRLRGRPILLAGVMLVPNVPFRRMRLMALVLSPARFIAFNENLDHFMLRPRSVPAILAHAVWRLRNLLRSLSEAARSTDWRLAAWHTAARLAGSLRISWRPARSTRQKAGSAGMLTWRLEPGLEVDTVSRDALARAFGQVPGLFCATAPVQSAVPGSTLNYVLRANSRCAVYDEAKLLALSGEEPAHREFRAWQNGWPTVQVDLPDVPANTAPDLTKSPRFLVSAVQSRKVFLRLWREALRGLSVPELRTAARIALSHGRSFATVEKEELFLALTGGDVAVFPGRLQGARPVILVATPYLPFPLSHGGAVRMFNLMLRAATEFDQVLVAFADDLSPPPPSEILNICVEVVLVRRRGSHSLPSTGRPDVVEEFDSDAFHAALRQLVRKYRPAIAQLEFTQMAQYAADCAPARTVLVEHDVTFDLYQQHVLLDDSRELRRQLKLWRRFEQDAWRRVDCVVTMSEKDRRMVTKSAHAVTLPNGVDLDRFTPGDSEPAPRRLLFIGSFAHLPNLVALEFFLKQVWPLLRDTTLHVIGGAKHEYFLNFYRDRVSVDLAVEGLELDGFVSDVRPAYRRATVVVAPLTASAGTNIKVLEAMAMGKAVVSTHPGVNGLDVTPDRDILVVDTAEAMADAIADLLADPLKRRRIGSEARRTVEREYGWDPIARKAADLYRSLSTEARCAS